MVQSMPKVTMISEHPPNFSSLAVHFLGHCPVLDGRYFQNGCSWIPSTASSWPTENCASLVPTSLGGILALIVPFHLSGGDSGFVKGQCSIRAAASPKSEHACRSPQEPSCICSGIRGQSCGYVTSSKFQSPSEMSFFFEGNALHLSQGFVVCPLGCMR